MKKAKLLLAGAALVAAPACDIPTVAPEWETLWVFPIQGEDARSATVSVESLLPQSVTVSADGSAFVIDLDPLVFSRSLGDLCSACSAVEGATVPKPAFEATLRDELELGADVVGATLAGGRVVVTIRNDFNFDPLRPSSSARGSLTVTLSSGGTVLDRETVLGEQTALPANGGTVSVVFDLAAADVAGSIAVELQLVSPAGDATRIETSDRLTVTADPEAIRLTEVEARVVDRSVISDTLELKLEDVDSTVIENVAGGALRLDIQNPFAVEGRLDLRITAPGVSISKSLTVQEGANQARLEFTGEELRSILGRPDVRLTLGGTVTAPSGTVALRPGQELQIETDLEIAVVVGGG